PIDISIGEVRERTAGLFEEREEQHREKSQNQHDIHSLPRYSRHAESLEDQVAESNQTGQRKHERRGPTAFLENNRTDMQDGDRTFLQVVDPGVGNQCYWLVIRRKECKTRYQET